MKLTSRPLYLRLLAIILVLSFGACLYAQPRSRPFVPSPHQDLIDAYFLLKHANNNYNGHRGQAMQHVASAGRALNLRLEGDVVTFGNQWKSDQKMAQARYLLFHARDSFAAADRQRAARDVQGAINEIDRAIGPSRVMPPPPVRSGPFG